MVNARAMHGQRPRQSVSWLFSGRLLAALEENDFILAIEIILGY